MTTRQDGGPAFPCARMSSDGERIVWDEPGMTLRDWFAGQAMAALVRRAVSREDWARLGLVSYECADAMIKARAIPTQPKE